MESLKDKTAKGLFWGGLSSVVQQVVGLVFGIILGRLLMPDDFGMVAMISVFSLIATTLQNSGFKTALINRKDPVPNDYNAVFWFNIIMGLSIYVILFFSSPLIALYYNVPELVWLCRYAFLGFVFASFGTAQAAYLIKNMRMKEVAQTGMTAVVVSSIVGAVMAWQGFAYWSLATQSNVFIGLNTLLLWWHSDWRPTVKRIDFSPVKEMFSFSVKILISFIVNNINVNVMNILLGRYHGKQQAGIYNQAYQWSFKCFSLVQSMINQIDQPVLVKLHDERERQLFVLRKMVRFTAFVGMPLMLGLALVSREFIVLALTEKWLPSAELLQLLCISGAVMPLCTLLSDAIVSKSRSDIFMWGNIALCMVLFVVLYSLRGNGVFTMAVAYVAINITWLFVWFFFVRRMTGYMLLSLLKDILPFAIAAFVVMVITKFATDAIENLWLLLFSRIVLAILLYVAVMLIARVRIFADCMEFFMARFLHRDKMKH